jgi:hypothetical protein
MKDRLSVTKSHRSLESSLADYYSIDDGRWPAKQSNSIPKKGDADFGVSYFVPDLVNVCGLGDIQILALHVG